jgi:hypothetical protein
VSSVKLFVKVTQSGRPVFTGHFTTFPILFGRADHCQISIPSVKFLSRVHGAINVIDGRIEVSDQSRHGSLRLISGEALVRTSFDNSGRFKVSDLLFELDLVRATAAPDAASPVREKKRVARVTEEKPLPENPKTELTSVTALVRSEFLPPRTMAKDGMVVETALEWRGDTLEVQQFRPDDIVWVSGDPEAPIFLPGLKRPLVIGRVQEGQCDIRIPQKISWHLEENGIDITEKVAATAPVKSGRKRFFLEPEQTLFCDLENDITVRVRFVAPTKFFVQRRWIENRDEFVRAITISGLFHLLACAVFLLAAPKISAPKIPNVPTRFARLIVAPPETPLAAKPPPPPPEPPAPPKPLPPKPKIEARVKAKPQPRPKTPPPRTPPPTAVAAPKETAPQKSAEAAAADELMAALAGPGPKTVDSNRPINIKDNSMPTNGSQGNLSTGALSSSLKAKGGKLASGQTGGGEISKVGQLGYAQTGNGKAGKRGVLGAVVGAPSLEDFSDMTNGLTEKEVMAEVNKHLAKIQRCYERSLLNNAGLAGRVQYGWEISPAGQVTTTRVQRSEMPQAEELNTCVTGIIRAMRFPVAKSQRSTTASLSFSFGKEN